MCRHRPLILSQLLKLPKLSRQKEKLGRGWGWGGACLVLVMQLFLILFQFSRVLKSLRTAARHGLECPGAGAELALGVLGGGVHRIMELCFGGKQGMVKN